MEAHNTKQQRGSNTPLSRQHDCQESSTASSLLSLSPREMAQADGCTLDCTIVLSRAARRSGPNETLATLATP